MFFTPTNPLIATGKFGIADPNLLPQFSWTERWISLSKPWDQKLFLPVADQLGIDLVTINIDSKEGQEDLRRIQNASLDLILGLNREKFSDFKEKVPGFSGFVSFLEEIYRVSRLDSIPRLLIADQNLHWTLIKNTLVETGEFQTGYGVGRHWEKSYDHISLKFRGVEIQSLSAVLTPKGKTMVSFRVGESGHRKLLEIGKEKNIDLGGRVRSMLRNTMKISQDPVSHFTNGNWAHYLWLDQSNLADFLLELYNSGARVEKKNVTGS